MLQFKHFVFVLQADIIDFCIVRNIYSLRLTILAFFQSSLAT